MESKMDFYKRGALVLKSIPQGKVATYGQIALLCGKPGNSRQVGYGLGRNLMVEDIPAYKVVNAQGILSGAAAFETFDMQKLLLEQECSENQRLKMLELKRRSLLDEIHFHEKQLSNLDYLRHNIRKNQET